MTYKTNDIIVIDCGCGCNLKKWIGTVIGRLDNEEAIKVEFTEHWTTRQGHCYTNQTTIYENILETNMTIRYATKEERFMYMIYGSRALEKG